jgi:Gpi18-like mannosyltransferase
VKIKPLLKIYLFWQIFIILVVLFSSTLLPLRSSGIFLGGGITSYLKTPLVNFRSNFDGVHYILIAANGYNFGQQAFFPFYPAAIRFFTRFLHQPIVVASLISAVSFYIGLFFLIRLIRLDFSKGTAFWTIVCLLFFPTGFFFTIVYSEGLCFLFLILSFYFARKGNWLFSGIFGGLCAYTRLVGVFLFPALLIELWLQKAKLRNIIPLLLIPLGLFVYMYYLHRTTGDYLAFYHVQTLFNQSRSLKIILPYQVIWRYIKMVLTVSQNDFIYPVIWLEFIIGIIFMALSVWSFFRQRLSYAVFSASAFFLPTLTGNFTSLPRYVLMCFPVFIALGRYLYGHPKFRILYLLISATGFIIYLSLFARGYWVA